MWHLKPSSSSQMKPSHPVQRTPATSLTKPQVVIPSGVLKAIIKDEPLDDVEASTSPAVNPSQVTEPIEVAQKPPSSSNIKKKASNVSSTKSSDELLSQSPDLLIESFADMSSRIPPPKERRNSSTSKSSTEKERSSNSRSHHHRKMPSKKCRKSKESKSVANREGPVHKPEESCVNQSSNEDISDPIVTIGEATPSSVQAVETPIVHPAKPEEEPSVDKQKPTSTDSIKTPEQTSSQSPSSPEPTKKVVAAPLDLSVGWKGLLDASEGKVRVQAHEISSGVTDLAELGLPPVLELIGRIRPEKLWDYVNQSQQAGSEVIVFRIAPADDSDSSNRNIYSTYLGNLHKSDQFAIVGNVSKFLIYIVPLPKESPIPVALTTLSPNMKAYDEDRTSQLLGVVVRSMRELSGDSAPSKPAKMAKTRAPVSSISSTSITLPASSTSSSSLSDTATVCSSPKSAVEAAQPSIIEGADKNPFYPGQLLDDTQDLESDFVNLEPLPKSVKSVDPFKPETGGKHQPGGVARPKRENRQPPKHLRDAFYQLEFEAATTLKKSHAAGVSKQEEPYSSLTNTKSVDPFEPKSGGVARPNRENRPPPKHLRDAFYQLEFEAATVIKKSRAASVSKQEELASSLTNNKSSSISECPAIGETEEVEKGENEDGLDDEDPGKLWCFCKEPLNNRFMICCDKCDDWYHGSCVGVTRAIGRQLEKKGLEWICPNCVRQEYVAKQQTSQDGLLESPGTKKRKKEAAEKSAAANTRDPVVKLIDVVKENAAHLDQKKNRVKRTGSSTVNSTCGPEPESVSGSEKRKCVLPNCKNEVRPNSIYCGDECIMIHARESLLAMSKLESVSEKQQTSSNPSTPNNPGKCIEPLEFGELMIQPTPTSTKSKLLKKPANLADTTSVPVMERLTGKILTSSNAPKVDQPEQWLKEHPTYEVIKSSTLPVKNRTPVPVVRQNSASQPGTPTSSAPSPASSKTSGSASSKKPDRSKLARKRSIEATKEDKKASQPDPESFRVVCKNAIKDALWNRCKDEDDLSGKIDEAGTEAIASEVEEALYRHFNKEVGLKYKSKYRSLVFNIKDVKNSGLFRQIAEKQITPGQLVKMTADELASKELAEWREREAKHQLDIIEKTELENMDMANKYLVKTHKGEEVIERAANELALEADRSEVASSILGSDTDGPNGPSSSDTILDLLQDTTDRHKSHLFDLSCRICSGQAKPDDNVIKVSSKTSSDRKVSDKKSSSSSSKKKDNKDKERRESRDNERSIDKGKDRRDSKEKDRKGKEHRHTSSSDCTTTKERSSNSQSHYHHKKHSEKDSRNKESKSVANRDGPVHKPEETCVNQSSIEDISDPIVTSVEATPSTQAVETPIVHHAKPEEKPCSDKQELTSTDSIKTPEQMSSQSPPSPQPAAPLDLIVGWKGVINASEGKVRVQAHEISSGMIDLAELGLPPTLDLVGRIRPEMVWDHINQSRRVASRDVIVFRIAPAADSDSSDRKMYSTYLGNLHKSNRFAVVGNIPKFITDFYIVPLPEDSPVPDALTALSHNMKAFDKNSIRTSQLLGVVVRIKRKRPGNSTSSKPAKIAKTVVPVSSIKSSSITPPGSSTSSPTLNYIPTIRSSQKKSVGAAQPTTTTVADEILISPGQLLDDDEGSQNSPDVVMKPEEMLEELNRKMEDTEMELSAVLSASALEDVIPGLGEPVIPRLGGPSSIGTSSSLWKYTRVSPASNPPVKPLAINPVTSSFNLNLNNLQEIISTIQKKEEELKKTKEPAKMDQLPTHLFSPSGDVDMRVIPPVITAAPVEKKKSSLIHQMTDEELMAKAIEMEMEQSPPPPISVPFVPAPIQQPVLQQGPSFYFPYGRGPPHPPGMMGRGLVPMPPMIMNPLRLPFYSSSPHRTTSPPFRSRNNH